MESPPLHCPWHPLPEDAVVQLVAIERPAIRRHRSAPPTEPARVVWSVVIRRDANTHERHDLPADVFRALAGDGGERIQPMSEITGCRLNIAVQRVTDGSQARDAEAGGAPAQEQRGDG